MMKRICCLAICLVLALCPLLSCRADSALDFRMDEAPALISEARDEFMQGGRTPLNPPVVYRILWLGYTHVRYNSLDFRMTDADIDYLKSVTLNFEKYVEKTTGRSLDIRIDLELVDREVSLTRAEGEEWLYLTRETAQPDIDYYMIKSPNPYDTVITTVQTQGQANTDRNRGKPGFGVNYVMLGIKTHGLENDLGYSSFDLGEPAGGTWPLQDPEIPSLYATAVAVHEWLHQLESRGERLGIAYPSTHADMGPPEFTGYRKIISDQNNYDYFEFYEQVLTGKVPYTGKGGTQYLGMYPKMWKLIRRTVLNYGKYTIRTGNGKGKYLAADGTNIILSDRPYYWTLRYAGENSVIISSVSLPELRIDLDNAWDNEGTRVKMNPYSGYLDAQRWYLTKNTDGSYYIRTAFSSRRPVSLSSDGKSATIQTVGSGSYQRWFITEEK